MGGIIWSHRAEKDLHEIHAYISRDSMRYADLFIERIHSKTLALARHPELGRRVPEIRFRRYREIIVDPFRIIYRWDPRESAVYVIAAVHGKRILHRAL